MTFQEFFEDCKDRQLSFEQFGEELCQLLGERLDRPHYSPIDWLLQFFEYGHLSEDLQVISGQLAAVARAMAEQLPSNPETTTGIRKLLEAKDCFVRAKISVGR